MARLQNVKRVCNNNEYRYISNLPDPKSSTSPHNQEVKQLLKGEITGVMKHGNVSHGIISTQ